MALPTWIPAAPRSERTSVDGIFWRCVEAQHVVSTLQLVDTLEEQRVLEDLLEETKPPVPAECAGLHYLYMTPFRYGLYPNGSRFRRAGQTPGVYYVSQAPATAIIETAFHRLLFYADSPATPFPVQPSEHTAFDVPVRSAAALDLTTRPFSKARAIWMHPSNYDPCQELEEGARADGITLICYASVRDPEHRLNAALLTCAAFAAKAPSQNQTWRLLFNKAGVHAICEFHGAKLSLPPEIWTNDPRLAALDWTRTG
jgi:RES domain